MRECIGIDELVGISRAVEDDIDATLRHLETCRDCREQLEDLHVARAAITETVLLSDAALERVAAAVRDEALRERTRVQAARPWANVLEALLAAATAVALLIWSGIRIAPAATVLLATAAAAAVLVFQRLHGENGVAPAP